MGFSHELAHNIQHDLYGVNINCIEIMENFEDNIIFEREAYRLAYYLYKEYFREASLKHMKKIIHFIYFNRCYRSQKSIAFLRNKQFLWNYDSQTLESIKKAFRKLVIPC